MAGLLSGLRIVVVEDHSDTEDLLEQCLRYEDAIVKVVPTAREALAVVSEADLIVTDFLLSGADEDGAWLLEQV
jgi:CheY-like chemotaxis protein